MEARLEDAYAEACQALGEQIVTTRMLAKAHEAEKAELVEQLAKLTTDQAPTPSRRAAGE